MIIRSVLSLCSSNTFRFIYICICVYNRFIIIDLPFYTVANKEKLKQKLANVALSTMKNLYNTNKMEFRNIGLFSYMCVCVFSMWYINFFLAMVVVICLLSNVWGVCADSVFLFSWFFQIKFIASKELQETENVEVFIK